MEGKAALHDACCEVQVDSVSMLLEFRADHSLFDSEGKTPLHCASQAGSFDCASLLVEAGSHDLPDSYGDRAVDYARRGRHAKVASLLQEPSVTRDPVDDAAAWPILVVPAGLLHAVSNRRFPCTIGGITRPLNPNSLIKPYRP